jgi:hypothetical protein
MKPAIAPQSTPTAPSAEGDARALCLLRALRAHQAGACRSAALAWERAAFAECFLDPEPARRVRAFLEGNRP